MGADLTKQCSRHVSPQSPHLDRQELLPSGRLVRQDNQCCGLADLVVCFVDESWEIRKYVHPCLGLIGGRTISNFRTDINC